MLSTIVRRRSQVSVVPIQTITVNTILYCRKWTQTVAFYRDKLGLRESFANSWFVEFDLCSGARLSVANAQRATIDSADGKGVTVSVEVPDLSGARDTLVRAGVQPTAVRRIWGSQAMYVFDPEGNRLEFWSRRD